MVIYVRIVAAEAREVGASDARNEGEADPPTIILRYVVLETTHA